MAREKISCFLNAILSLVVFAYYYYHYYFYYYCYYSYYYYHYYCCCFIIIIVIIIFALSVIFIFFHFILFLLLILLWFLSACRVWRVYVSPSFFFLLVNDLHFIFAMVIQVKHLFFIMIIYMVVVIIIFILFLSTLLVIVEDFSKWIQPVWSTNTHFFFVSYSLVTIVEVLTASFIFVIFHHLIWCQGGKGCRPF